MKKLPKKCSPKNGNHLQFHIIKVNEKKINKILILHLNFILETPLKIKDIKKINALQFYKRNPFKTEQTKKIKNGEFFSKRPLYPSCNLKVDF